MSVLEAARLANIKRVVFGSSIGYYGRPKSSDEKPVNEDDPPSPSPAKTYQGIQWFNEYVGKAYNIRYGMEAICARMTMTYGPGKEENMRMRWIDDIVVLPAQGKPVTIPLRSTQRTMPLAYTDDTIEAIIHLCLKDKLKHQTYLIGGESIYLHELADIIRQYIPDAQISFNEKAEDLGLISFTDSSRISEELGITPRSVNEGIKQFAKIELERFKR
jgi:nucleoside-diphosphate-sugar epimerase